MASRLLRLPAAHPDRLGHAGALRRDLAHRAGTVALVAPVTTWQAYNAWGGYSLYSGANGDSPSHAVSFDRPYNGATGANDYRTAAIPIIVRAEQTGVPLSWFTNIDLATTPGVLEGARGYVSMGHDEYWTNSMRDAVLEARDAGTNLAFLGANTMYWRIRLEPAASGRARVVVGYRHSAHLDPLYAQGSPEATANFREARSRAPSTTCSACSTSATRSTPTTSS